MTGAAGPTGTTDEMAAVAARVRRAYGEVVALDMYADDVRPLIDLLDWEIDDDRTQVRLLLGAACTTAARAVDQIVAALQLPYPATRGWEDMLDHLGERRVSQRMIVVVADAGDLLRYEEADVWHRLAFSMRSGPHCLGGGYTTLVLVDDAYGWEKSSFGSAAAAERAAAEGWRRMARPRYVRANLDED